VDLDGNRSRFDNGRAGFAGRRGPRADHSSFAGSRGNVAQRLAFTGSAAGRRSSQVHGWPSYGDHSRIDSNLKEAAKSSIFKTICESPAPQY